jgi:hypothetical protein
MEPFLWKNVVMSFLIMTNTPLKHEEEHTGSIWKHPYMVYIVLTIALFLLLVWLGYLAWENGWIPSRGIGVNS